MKKKTVIIIHLLYWFYFINQSLYPIYIGQLDKANMIDNQYLKNLLITTFLNLITFYAIYFSFPRLLKLKNKVLAAGTGLVMLAMLTTFRVITDYLFWKYFGNLPQQELIFKWVWVWGDVRLVIVTGTYAVLISFMISWFETQKLKDELINQQQAGELALLRSQVNPHFLFNTLNNIYSLVYKKSDEAPAAVMKLSSIMRYMFYDATSDKVPLEKEIEYLKSFIELQKLRIKNPDFVSLHIEGNAEGHSIAPMLLISFVENAFKHGSRKQQPGIIVRLSALTDRINFEVINYLRKTTLSHNENESGIGLINIRRRLELMYPDKHNLLISVDAETFRINLVILN